MKLKFKIALLLGVTITSAVIVLRVIVLRGLEPCGWLREYIPDNSGCLLKIDQVLALQLFFSSDGEYLTALTIDGRIDEDVLVWSANDGTLYDALVFTKPDAVGLSRAALAPDGDTLAVRLSSGIQFWSIRNKKLLDTLEGWTSQFIVTPDWTILAESNSYTVRLWRIQDKTLVREIETTPLYGENIGQTGISTLAFSPDGEILAIGLTNGMIQLWQVSSGKLLYSLQGHNNTIGSLAFSPNGGLLASGSWDNNITLWQVNEGVSQAVLEGEAGHNHVDTLAFSPDNEFLAAGIIDGTLHLWRIENASLIRTLNLGRWYANDIDDLTFSPDGRILASAQRYGPVRLFDFQKLVGIAND